MTAATPSSADYSVAEIVRALHAPERNVAVSWPLLLQAMRDAAIAQPLVQVAMIATIGVETWVSRRINGVLVEQTFLPIEEVGTEESLNRYDVGALAALRGNTPADDGDGERLRGRGFIQHTGRTEYERVHAATGVDVLTHPELLLQPDLAALGAVSYFVAKKIPVYARLQDWPTVRRRVNGALTGWARFQTCVNALLQLKGLAPAAAH